MINKTLSIRINEIQATYLLLLMQHDDELRFMFTDTEQNILNRFYVHIENFIISLKSDVE